MGARFTVETVVKLHGLLSVVLFEIKITEQSQRPCAPYQFKRVSLATLWKILGLEDIKDNSGRVIQDALLELWANLKQRALDVALKEINQQSDIQLELEFIGRGAFRKVLSLGFRINGRNVGGKGTA